MKLTEKIHLLQIDFEIALSPEKKLARFVNTLIIFGDKITLIDTGTKGSEEKIFDYINENGRNISDIDMIILSHSHPDHIGAARRIKDVTGCRVFAHKEEAAWIENIHLQNEQRPVPGFFSLVDASVYVDSYLTDNTIVQAAHDVTMQIIHAPGHSKGSVNILFKEDKILFTADSIPLKNDIPNYDNYYELMDSLIKIRDNNQYSVLLTSWTPPLTSKPEIDTLIAEGEEFLLKIDNAVKESYVNTGTETIPSCKEVLGKLGLPPMLAIPIVDKAFRSHLE